MDERTVTLTVALAGIASTLIVGGVGLYFTAKSRSARYREALFERQLEIAVQIVYLQSRIRVFATILAGEDATYKSQARDDIRDYFRQFSETEQKAAVLLPVELWVEAKNLSDEISEAIGEYDSKETITPARMTSLVARMTKVALLSRVVLGVDELTEQSLALFSSQKAYTRVASLEVSHFEEVHRQVNRDDA
jgi:hypothetical protein